MKITFGASQVASNKLKNQLPKQRVSKKHLQNNN